MAKGFYFVKTPENKFDDSGKKKKKKHIIASDNKISREWIIRWFFCLN